MAAEVRQSGTDLKFIALQKMLQQEPFSVQFFQAVRLLERISPERKPVGIFVSPQSEVLRFSSLPTLAFPPSELYSLERKTDGQQQMTVQFMGLCSAISVMPTPYTEMLLARMREKDYGPNEFFDLFNHRMISLFYRGWQKYRFYIGYERGGEDSITPRLLDLLGLGTQGLRNRMAIPDEACLYYAGLLAPHVRSATGLRQILEDYFRVPVTIEQFAGTWRRLPADNQTFLLGQGGANELLGVGTVVGDEAWDQHGRLLVRLGPMPLSLYRSFLPGEQGHKELAAWLRFYSNRRYDCEVQLVLHRDDAPRCHLGEGEAPRLGFISWLKNRSLERDPDEATYLVE